MMNFFDNNQVYIWLLNIQDLSSINYFDYLSILSWDEREKYQSFKVKSVGERFVINRAYLRLILAKYLQLNPQDIVFKYNAQGKPFLDLPFSPLYFNLSHKNHYTVYSIALHPVGIDLEKIDFKVKVEDISKRFFCQKEYNYLITLNEKEKREYFFTLWTIKEAYLKSIGKGLSGGLNSICLENYLNKDKYQLINYQGRILNNFAIKTWKIFEDYILSIAIKNLHNTFVFYSANKEEKINL